MCIFCANNNKTEIHGGICRWKESTSHHRGRERIKNKTNRRYKSTYTHEKKNCSPSVGFSASLCWYRIWLLLLRCSWHMLPHSYISNSQHIHGPQFWCATHSIRGYSIIGFSVVISFDCPVIFHCNRKKFSKFVVDKLKIELVSFPFKLKWIVWIAKKNYERKKKREKEKYLNKNEP